MGAKLFHAGGRMGRHDEASQFWTRIKTWKLEHNLAFVACLKQKME
jgi:hypothetical protein